MTLGCQWLLMVWSGWLVGIKEVREELAAHTVYVYHITITYC